MSKRLSVVLLACVFSAWACGGGGGDTAKPAAPAKPAASAEKKTEPKAVAGQPTGSITGKISWNGPKPREITVKMAADPYCDSANEGGVTRMAPNVSADGGMIDIFIYVKAGLTAKYETPTEKVLIDQRSCNYVPSVVGVMTNQPIEIMNSDSTLHNVHALPENSKGFNIGMPTKGMKSTRKFPNPEALIRIKCDVHPWMETYVGVVENPFHAVTGDDGRFELADVPPGEYTIEAVHPRLGARSATVKVASGAAATADFEFTPSK